MCGQQITVREAGWAAKLKGKCGKVSSNSSDFSGKYRRKDTAAADSKAMWLRGQQLRGCSSAGKQARSKPRLSRNYSRDPVFLFKWFWWMITLGTSDVRSGEDTCGEWTHFWKMLSMGITTPHFPHLPFLVFHSRSMNGFGSWVNRLGGLPIGLYCSEQRWTRLSVCPPEIHLPRLEMSYLVSQW